MLITIRTTPLRVTVPITISRRRKDDTYNSTSTKNNTDNANGNSNIHIRNSNNSSTANTTSSNRFRIVVTISAKVIVTKLKKGNTSNNYQGEVLGKNCAGFFLRGYVKGTIGVLSGLGV